MRRVAAVALVFAVVAAACTGDESDRPASTTTSPAVTTAPMSTAGPTATSPPTALEAKPYGGTVRVPQLETSSLNPWLSAAAASKRTQELFQPQVWTIDPDLDVRPGIVVEIPTLENGRVVENEDDTVTVRYSIRPEAVWADEVPISGADFRFTYETVVNPEYFLPGLPGGTRERFDQIIPETIVAGTRDFEFTLERPIPRPGQLFDWILPEHALAGTDFQNDWDDRLWMSGGPFMFDEWIPGEVLRFVRNPNYRETDPDTGQRLPYLDAIEMIPLEPSAANDALAGRAVHVDWPLLAPEVADVFDGADIRVVSQPASGGWTHLTFQFSVDSDDTAANPLRDERFRQAVALALDRPSLARAVTGTDRAILQSPLGAISPSLSLEPWDRYDLDLESARQLVAEVCQDFGRDCSAQPLTVIAQAGDQQVRRLTLDTVAETLAAIGLDVDVELIPEREWFSRGIGSGDWDLSTWTWVSTPGLLGAIEMLHLFDPLGLDLNYWADSDNTARLERYSEILAEIDTTIFEPDLVPLIAEAERILADELVVLPLFEQGGDTAWHDDMVGGLTPHPVTALGLWDAALWYRVDDNAGNEELTPRQIVELYGDADLDPPVSE